MLLFFKKIRLPKREGTVEAGKSSVRRRIPLCELSVTKKSGNTVRIRALGEMPPEVRARLFAFGLFRGNKARLLQRKADGESDPLLSRDPMALGGEISSRIEVDTLD